MKNAYEPPQLEFFIGMSEEYLQIEGFATALQNIETTLRMTQIRRWPACIALMWQSIELLLRISASKGPNDTTDVFKLQEAFNSRCNMSEGLSKESHNLRRLRNEILHHGYSPKDDEECIRVFFGPGFAYIDKLISELTGESLIQIGRKETPNQWYWDIFEDTRKIINTKSRKKRQLSDGLLPICLAAERINRVGGKVSEHYYPGDTFNLSGGEWDDVDYEIRAKVGQELAEEIQGGSGEIVFIPGYKCFKRCDHFSETVIADFEWGEVKSDGYEVLGVNAIACINCNYVITDSDTIQTMVWDRLSNTQIQILEAYDFLTAADTHYQGCSLSKEQSPKSHALYEKLKVELE